MSPDTSAEKQSEYVQQLLRRMVEEQGIPVLHISAFGHKFDSGFWIAVNTDAERDRLFADEPFRARLQAVFKNTGYLALIEDIWNREIKLPELAYLKTPGITFESQETVDRDHGGSWYSRVK